MATLVLQAAGQAIGSFLGPVGGILGKAAGSIAGAFVDQAIFGGSPRRSVGKLDDLSVQTSSEGNPIPAVYGRMRLAGTVIWATPFEEEVNDTGGGKGGGPRVEEYSYYANFAVGLAEGPISRIGRIWADGQPLELEDVAFRVHLGSEDQAPDPLILAKEGSAPAYRGLAYVVFERLPVTQFGNRLPQLTFEIVRAVDALEERVRAVTVIPGATEFGYHTVHVKRTMGPGEYETDNRVLGLGATDFEASIDELLAICPNLERVALVVAWFGDDLDAARCRVEPRIEYADRTTTGASWSVAGLDRGSAKAVSMVDGRPAYGGTPDDASVSAAIAALRARGIRVTFYPFLLMDVPPGNGKADPYGGAEQAAFPWRGRITVSPAPGLPGSPDGTAAAAEAADRIIGSVGAGDFAVDGTTFAYWGPAEWSLSRMALHYAALCRAAGGVDAFLVGSELRGLTTLRGPGASYPFVEGLRRIAGDVAVLSGPETRVSYAADWSEFFGHQPADGSGDVFFHLDPLWADPAVSFVGIDVYWPLSDWRDGSDHLDAAIADTVHHPAYLAGNVAGGEGFDWYYASPADRYAQVRTPITDGGAGKPWVFRYKDLVGWWSNLHHDRPGGVEAATPTGWRPGLKPIWFTEVGCPAIERGSNQPNVFYDPKSSESALPHFSNGGRDDAIQRRYLEAILSHFTDDDGGLDARNPRSPIDGARMVDAGGIHLWTWDARPWPAFPLRLDVWADGRNWEGGHWLTGRLGGVSLAGLARALFLDHGLPAPEVDGLAVCIDGYVRPRPTALRDEIEQLAAAFAFRGIDTGTGIRLVSLDRRGAIEIGYDDLVEEGADDPLVVTTRREDDALPREQRLQFLDSGRDFASATARAQRSDAASRHVETAAVAAALADSVAAQAAEIALFDAWSGRTAVSFRLPRSRIALGAGDVVALDVGGTSGTFLVEEIEDAGRLLVSARAVDRSVFRPTPVETSGMAPASLPAFGAPVVHVLDLPRLGERFEAHQPLVAAWSRPWPHPMAVWWTRSGESYRLATTFDRPSTVGEVVTPPPAGPFSRWDVGGSLMVRLYARTLESRADLEVLAGRNAIAIRVDDGGWEVIQFGRAELVGDGIYRLSRLLRGQSGTEDVAAAGISAGAPAVVLDGHLKALPLGRDAIGTPLDLRVGPLRGGHAGSAVAVLLGTAGGRGLKPLSPVHLRAVREAAGDIRLTWIRRTRVGGDDWSGEDVPLGEEAERYRLEILVDGSVVRTANVAEPAFRYALADQVADLGAAPAALHVRVAQVAPGLGPGIWRDEVVPVR